MALTGWTAALSGTLGASHALVACPFCGSSTAEQVRAGIFNPDFGYHLSAAFAPFSVLIAVLFLIYHWPSLRRSNRHRGTRPSP
ncbi:MAG: hypothetical protein ACO1RT_20270 [Planctomycetaceae bacterium]